MKISRYFTALLLTLAFVLSVYAIFQVQDINTKLDTISKAQDSISDEFKTLVDSLPIESQNRKIDALESKLDTYTEKVDSMVMDYMTLDEILRQMFGKAQAEYMQRKVGE